MLCRKECVMNVWSLENVGGRGEGREEETSTGRGKSVSSTGNANHGLYTLRWPRPTRRFEDGLMVTGSQHPHSAKNAPFWAKTNGAALSRRPWELPLGRNEIEDVDRSAPLPDLWGLAE